MITYKIDATNKVLGRLSTEIAGLLRGKNKPDFEPHKLPDVKVIVFNIEKTKLTGKKSSNKIYLRHTGYVGHLKTIKASEIIKKDPSQLLRFAVSGMLPKNKLRAKMLKNLELHNGNF